jgi:CRP/FNR family transcriptional regulator, dissimilatory nitrate respiration regulator
VAYRAITRFDIPSAELDLLAQGCLLRRFERGEDVFRVGQRCEEFHICVTGQVKLYAVSAVGAEKLIDLIWPSQSFAEALMFTGSPYIISAQAEAQPETVPLPVSKATVASRLSLTPEYFSRVLHELEAAGLVRIDKRDVHILDAQALAGYRAG